MLARNPTRCCWRGGRSKWDDPGAVRPSKGCWGAARPRPLREPAAVRVHPALASSSPLKTEKVEGVDVLFVRELTGGLYFGTPRCARRCPPGHGQGSRGGHPRVHRREIRRVVRLAFRLAGPRKRGDLGRQANVLESHVCGVRLPSRSPRSSPAWRWSISWWTLRDAPGDPGALVH